MLCKSNMDLGSLLFQCGFIVLFCFVFLIKTATDIDKKIKVERMFQPLDVHDKKDLTGFIQGIA